MSQRIQKVDADLTKVLANAAYQAYYSSIQGPLPAGYKYYGRWTGRNPSILGGDVEDYGIIFQGELPTNSSSFIFAFKGTASFWDAYEDLFVNWAHFVSHNNSNASNQVEVSDGFFSVYSTPVTPGHNDSMQDQLFQLIDKIKPSEIIITGHSLGSALAELFTLDLYLSLPQRNFSTKHINFACPRVGFLGFKRLYDGIENNLPPSSKTTRIVNFKDEIPCVPFNILLGYEHVGNYFLISFTKKKGIFPNYVVRHSLYNYWQVLNDIFKNPNQEYSGDVKGGHSIPLWSTAPSATETECSTSYPESLRLLADKLEKMEPIECTHKKA